MGRSGLVARPLSCPCPGLSCRWSRSPPGTCMAQFFRVGPLGKLGGSICNQVPLDRATILTFESLGEKFLRICVRRRN